MRYIRWSVILLFWGLFAAVLHYTLPQNDIVRVGGVEVRRVDFGTNSLFWTSPGTGDVDGTVNRDVFFIDTIRPNGRPMVYRNEDTGWGWPPYFKLDSSNLQAEARDMTSTQVAPRWVAVRHYGWRFEPLSIFPNAVSVRPVEGPDTRIIPWFNIIFLTLLAALIWAIWARWRRFRARRIDPVVDEFEASVTETRGRFSGWLRSWRGPRN